MPGGQVERRLPRLVPLVETRASLQEHLDDVRKRFGLEDGGGDNPRNKDIPMAPCDEGDLVEFVPEEKS